MCQMQTRWQDKSLHSLYSARTKQDDVDKPPTHQWFRSAVLKAATEGFIFT